MKIRIKLIGIIFISLIILFGFGLYIWSKQFQTKQSQDLKTFSLNSLNSVLSSKFFLNDSNQSCDCDIELVIDEIGSRIDDLESNINDLNEKVDNIYSNLDETYNDISWELNEIKSIIDDLQSTVDSIYYKLY